MTHDDFANHQASIVEAIIQLGNTKGKEYARSDNRFDNFNRTADSLDLPRLKVAYIYLVKHLDAITSYCKNGEVISTESIHSRIYDAILYLMLIDGMIEETEQGPKEAYATNPLQQKTPQASRRQSGF